MFAKTRSMARKYGARIAAAPAALLVGFSAHAAEGDGVTEILAQVNQAMTSGKSIATAIVIGFFVIWAIKLLWRSK